MLYKTLKDEVKGLKSVNSVLSKEIIFIEKKLELIREERDKLSKNIRCIRLSEQDYADKYVSALHRKHQISEKLKEYTKLDDEGLLLKLPCNVGEKIYWINSYNRLYGDSKINEVNVIAYVWWGSHGFCIKIENINEQIPSTDVPISELNKTIFIAKIEAENALNNLMK